MISVKFLQLDKKELWKKIVPQNEGMFVQLDVRWIGQNHPFMNQDLFTA